MLRRSKLISAPCCPTLPEHFRALPWPAPSFRSPCRIRPGGLPGSGAALPLRRDPQTRACNQRKFRWVAHGEDQSLHVKEPAHGVHLASSCAPPEGFRLTAAAEDGGYCLAIFSRQFVCCEILLEDLAVMYFQKGHLAEHRNIPVE